MASFLKRKIKNSKFLTKEKHFQINLNFHSKNQGHFSLDGGNRTRHKSDPIVEEVTLGRYTNTHSFCLHQDT